MISGIFILNFSQIILVFYGVTWYNCKRCLIVKTVEVFKIYLKKVPIQKAGRTYLSIVSSYYDTKTKQSRYLFTSSLHLDIWMSLKRSYDRSYCFFTEGSPQMMKSDHDEKVPVNPKISLDGYGGSFRWPEEFLLYTFQNLKFIMNLKSIHSLKTGNDILKKKYDAKPL